MNSWIVQTLVLYTALQPLGGSMHCQYVSFNVYDYILCIKPCRCTRALLRLERTMNLLEGGKGGEGRVGERGWGGDGGRVGDRGWGGDVGERGRVRERGRVGWGGRVGRGGEGRGEGGREGGREGRGGGRDDCCTYSNRYVQ